MKRVLLAALVVALLAGQASAGLYTFDAATAAKLRDVSWTDASGFGKNTLSWVGYNPGNDADRVYGIGPYGATMFYAVGFAGNLSDMTGDGFASVKIGAAGNTSGVLDAIKALAGFEGFYLPISNDNNQDWQYKLYVDTTGSYYESASWTTLLTTARQTTLILDFDPGGSGTVDFSTLKDIGLIVQLDRSLIGNASDDFHTSVVPVPAGVLLGFLGLSVAGLGLRRLA